MKKRNKRRKLKKKVVIIGIALIVIVIIILIILLLSNSKKIEVELRDNLEVEINSDVKLLSFIKEVKNGKIETKNKSIDTSKLGKKELEVELSSKGKREKYKFKIKVVDTTKPEIVFKNEIKTEKGKKIDLVKDVEVSDNSKEDIEVQVEGEYDFDKVGKYNLFYVAKDSSGNESKESFVLIVDDIKEDNNKEDTDNNSNESVNTTFKTSKGFSGKIVNGVTFIDGVLIANKTYGLPSTYGPGFLDYVQKAFDKMAGDAKSLGYNFFIGSGFRSYNTQKTLYDNYVKKDGKENADTYSARAGYSEHQTGLAFDICDRNVPACVTSEFDTTDQAKWINDNCYKYGLIIRYPKGKDSITGYMYESWHLRYVGVDLATKLYNGGNWITLEEYFGIDSKYK